MRFCWCRIVADLMGLQTNGSAARVRNRATAGQESSPVGSTGQKFVISQSLGKGGHALRPAVASRRGSRYSSVFPIFRCGGFDAPNEHAIPARGRLSPDSCAAGRFGLVRPVGRQAAATGVTVFEGARLIVGDGRAPIENATFVVSGGRFTQVGSAADVNVPAGATRVNLAGKTVMPAIHRHAHASQSDARHAHQRPAAPRVLRRRDRLEHGSGHERRAVPDARPGTAWRGAQFQRPGAGSPMPEPGRTEAPFWVSTVAEARKAVQDNAAKKVDIIKIWVDDRNGTFKKLTPELYGAIIDEAHKNKHSRHRAYLRTRGREGAAARGARRLRARRARPGHRRGVHGLLKKHPNLVLEPEPARSRSAGRSQLAEGQPPGRRGAEARGGQHRSARRSRRPSASRPATWRR